MFKHWPVLRRREGLAILSAQDWCETRSWTLRSRLPWDWRRRIAVAATMRVAGMPVSFANVHLSPHDADAQRVAVADVIDHGRRLAVEVLGVIFNDFDRRQHFTVAALVCPMPPLGVAAGFMVDARMPEHRHGMNYRARVFRKPDGIYVAEGLLFHMPGLWQLMFDVERGGRMERLTTDIDLE